MKAWMAGVIGAILTVLTVFFYGKKQGSDDQKAEQNQQVLHNADKVAQERNRISSLSDVDVDNELQQYDRK